MGVMGETRLQTQLRCGRESSIERVHGPDANSAAWSERSLSRDEP
jgi:hypothetical protein